MKAYYIGLIAKVLLITVCVVGLFVALRFLGYRVFGGNEATATVTAPRSILLVLLERLEKAFVANRAELDAERAGLLARIAAAPNAAERRRLEALIHELDRKRKDNEARLSALAAEKKEIEAREKANAGRQAELDEARLKTLDETFDLKTQWKEYTDTLQKEFLSATPDEARKEEVRRGFEQDYGVSYISSFAREHYMIEQELAGLKGDTSTSDALNRTRGEKTEADTYIKELENKLKELNTTIKKNEGEIKDLQSQIVTLLDQSNINGYFISRNGGVILLTNKKKEAEILATGTFLVYDTKKKQVSKIYVTRRGGGIGFTKLPGYDNPRPGNWF